MSSAKSETFRLSVRCGACQKRLYWNEAMKMGDIDTLAVYIPPHKCRSASVRKTQRFVREHA